MTNVATTAPSSTDASKTSGSFAERINYDILYGDLDKRGVHLTEEEKKKLRNICTEELGKHNGTMLGTDIATSGVNLVYMLFAFIQNMFSGTMDLNNLGGNLSQAVGSTGERDKLHQLNNATIGIYQRLQSAGGNLARAAELTTGQKQVSAGDASDPVDMAGSVYRQIRKDIDLPFGTTASLDKVADAFVSPPLTTPYAPLKRALTRTN